MGHSSALDGSFYEPLLWTVLGLLTYVWRAAIYSSFSHVPFVGDMPFLGRAVVFIGVIFGGMLQHGWEYIEMLGVDIETQERLSTASIIITPIAVVLFVCKCGKTLRPSAMVLIVVLSILQNMGFIPMYSMRLFGMEPPPPAPDHIFHIRNIKMKEYFYMWHGVMQNGVSTAIAALACALMPPEIKRDFMAWQ